MVKLEPAATVIRMCGGINAAAKIVRIHRTVVYRWTQPKDRGGTGGQVPAHHAQRLLEANIPGLTPAHFFSNPRGTSLDKGDIRAAAGGAGS